MQVTGADVIHAWTIPAFGVKIDAVPGRLNETWFQAEEGTGVSTSASLRSPSGRLSSGRSTYGGPALHADHREGG